MFLKSIKFIVCLFALLLAQESYAQYQISGTVSNEQGERLKYASVFLKDNSVGTSSDENGRYVLENINPGIHVLKVTYLSYLSYEKELEINKDEFLNIVLKGDAFQLEEVELISNRVSENSPVAHDNISRETIERNNYGQDIPVLLNQSPSLVMTSDAGNGIGYTNIRIRGFDMTRINMNINGVPLNDGESQSVFFVNMPDLLSSTEDIQIQRGVGSSTNGPSSFGASVSLNTFKSHLNPFVELSLGYGTFNSKHLTGVLGTGLMNNKYAIDVRYSLINSDGYIDRASSDLESYYVSAVRFGKNSSLRFVSFSGHEKTYQAWNGVPTEKLYGTDADLKDHYNRNIGSLYNTIQDSINLFSSGKSYNAYTYENEVDDYQQTHYQLHYAKEWNDQWQSKAAAYSSVGFGYFEQFKYKDDYEDYFLPNVIINNDTLEEGDIIRRRTLDNVLYGGFFNTKYTHNQQSSFDLGLAGSTYNGDHYGNVVFAEHQSTIDFKERYYYSKGEKDEFSTYLKYNFTPNTKWAFFADMQYRFVQYQTKGTDNDQQNFDINHSFNFFNPKVGINYNIFPNSSLSLFAGISNKEPNRDDFVDVVNGTTPEHEQIFDVELAYKYRSENFFFEANTFYMNYKNQLVLRGDLNDVGANIRINVDDSYRTGIEAVANVKINNKLNAGLNLTLSQNIIKSYDEYIFDWEIYAPEITNFENTQIAFSPSLISSFLLNYQLFNNWNLNWNAKYVSKQYLDNTTNEDKTISSYLVNDLIVGYEYKSEKIKSIGLSLKVGNVFNHEYVSNGYTYAYIYGDKTTETFYFPQAGRTFSLAMKIKI